MGALFPYVEGREDSVLIQFDRNGLPHERDQVLSHDAELRVQPLERHEEAVSIHSDRNGITHDRDPVLVRAAETPVPVVGAP